MKTGRKAQELLISVLAVVISLTMVATVTASLRLIMLFDGSSWRACDTENLISNIDDLIALVDTSSSAKNANLNSREQISGVQLISMFTDCAQKSDVNSQQASAIKRNLEVLFAPSGQTDAIRSRLRADLHRLRQSESLKMANIVADWHEEAFQLSTFVILIQVLSIGLLILCVVLKRKVEAERAASQRAIAELARLVEFSQESIISVDRNCIVRSWNPGSEKMFGCTTGNAIGRTLKDWLVKDFDVDICAEVVSSGKPCASLELEMRTAESRYFWGQISISPIESLSTANNASHMIVIRDVTEQVYLRKQQADFVASLSHDLKNPIIANNMALTHLMSLTDESSRVQDIIKKIVVSNQQLLDMLNTMLDLYKVNAGKFIQTMMPVLVEKLVLDCIDCLQPRASLKQVSLSSSIECRSRTYQMDPLIVKKIVLNLLDNAVKFAPTASEVRITVDDDGCRLRIAVEDHGRGIADANLPELFSVSSKRQPAADAEPSSGLGLYLAKQLAIMIDADLTYTRLESGVSRFELCLPEASSVPSNENLCKNQSDVDKVCLPRKKDV